MTKYIDRYYLNGEMYAIRFAEPGWQPGANTILYVPMKDDLTDHSSHQYTLTNTGVSLVSTQADIDVGYFDGSSYLSGPSISNFTNFHVGFWIKMTSISGSQFPLSGISSGDLFLGYQTTGGNKIGIGRNGIAWDNTTLYTLSIDTWYYVSFDKQNVTLTISVNGNGIGTHSNNMTYSFSGGFQIGNDGTGRTVNGYLSELIIENKARTAQEISDYFNQTKSLYGIS